MSQPKSAKVSRRFEEEKSRQERKKINIAVAITLSVIALLVIFTLLFTSNLFYNSTTAVDINGVEFTVADFNFNYFTAYNNHYNTYYSYLQYIPGVLPSSGTPFDKQTCTMFGDGKSTWADYFEAQALSTMCQVAMLCNAAEADADFSLSEEDKAAVDETVAGIDTQAKLYGYSSTEAYLTHLYGKGMTEEIFRRNLERQAIANAYLTFKQDSFEYTEKELLDHYAENADDYDFFIYRIYRFSGAAVTDNKDTEEDETLSLDDAMAKAEADAKAFEAAVKSEQDFIDYAAELNKDSTTYDADASTLSQLQGVDVESRVIEDIYKWLIDSARKSGDVTVIGTAKDASSPGYYVLYFVERDNNQYKAANGWFGYIPVDNDVVEDTDKLTDEEKDKAIRDANILIAREVLNQYISGDEKTVEAFADVLADEANSDLVTSSGEINKIGRYDGPEELCDWLMDPERKEGDTEIIFIEDDGTYILYFSNFDDVYANIISDTALRSTATNDWMEAELKPYAAHKQWEMILSKKIPALS